MQALRALHLFQPRQAVPGAGDGKVQIVDEYTGRVLEGRTWEQGLHQLIEIKEGVRADGADADAGAHHLPALLPPLPAPGRHDRHRARDARGVLARRLRPAGRGASPTRPAQRSARRLPSLVLADATRPSGTRWRARWRRLHRRGRAGAGRHRLGADSEALGQAAERARPAARRAQRAPGRATRPRSSPAPASAARSRWPPTWPAAAPTSRWARAWPRSAGCT